MQIRVDHLTPCCGDQPSLDTWDKNEARSVRCIHCGRQTKSHFQREFAYDEWQAMMLKNRAPRPRYRHLDGGRYKKPGSSLRRAGDA